MSTIKANTLLHSDGSTTNPPAIPALDKRMAKAWINFNGHTSTIAIRDSEGVSSITDNGTGDYTIIYATAMANNNYSYQYFAGSKGRITAVCRMHTQTTTSLRFETAESGSGLSDTDHGQLVVFGGQA